MTGPHATSYRHNTLWIAAQVHRVSGLLLALFLPVHFLTLGLTLQGEARLDAFLAWTTNPLVKLGESLLLFLLAVHLLGGVRILAIENLPWQPQQKQMAMAAAVVAMAIAVIFLMRAA
jgi:fumarate reductase subunit D